METRNSMACESMGGDGMKELGMLIMRSDYREICGLKVAKLGESRKLFVMRSWVWIVGFLLLMGCGGEPTGKPPFASTEGLPTPPGTSPQEGKLGESQGLPSQYGAKVTEDFEPVSQSVSQAREKEPIYHLSRAQRDLPKVELFLGPHTLTAELCVSLQEIATGLMFRESLGEEDAMLFVFRTPRQRSFYMKNVEFPIAAAYIDSDGIIQEIVQLSAMDETPVDSQSAAIQFVLETVPDWFERHGIGPGTLVASKEGPLGEVLARRARLP